MRKHVFPSTLATFGTVLALAASLVLQTARGQGNTPKDFVPPVVFQAAGPNVESIQSSVDGFRTALGGPNNGNAPGPLASGRREINWDGGGGGACERPTPGVVNWPPRVFSNT